MQYFNFGKLLSISSSSLGSRGRLKVPVAATKTAPRNDDNIEMYYNPKPIKLAREITTRVIARFVAYVATQFNRDSGVASGGGGAGGG